MISLIIYFIIFTILVVQRKIANLFCLTTLYYALALRIHYNAFEICIRKSFGMQCKKTDLSKCAPSENSDKTAQMEVRPAKIQIRLRKSESSLGTFWKANYESSLSGQRNLIRLRECEG